MSHYYRENGKRWIPDYDSFRASDDAEVKKREIRTKQAFKDECDINQILKRAQREGSLSHVQKYPKAVYGEFDGEFDLLTATGKIARAEEIFRDLPSEIRSEFGNNALAFVKFAGDPANNSKLVELLPALAEPGRYFPNPVQRAGTGAGAATTPPEVIEAGSAATEPPAASPEADASSST